jgi:sugar lactone lactonase YvrE
MRVVLTVTMIGATFVFGLGAVGASARDEAGPAGQGYKVVGKIGKEGTGNGQFSNVTGLDTDSQGNVYVADGNLHRVQVFSSKGAFKSKYVVESGYVSDTADGPTGDVWAATQVGSDVRRFPKNGGTSESFGTPKSAEGLAVDGDNNVYVATSGDDIDAVVRFEKTATGWAAAKMWVPGGFQWPGDVEVSPDGTIYVLDHRGSPPPIRHFDASGKLLSTIRTKLAATAGAGAEYGIGVDPDCNLWATNGQQRRVDKFTPSGKFLGSVTSGDLLSTDIAIGPTGDLFVYDIYSKAVIHFAADKKKPGAANVLKAIAVKGGKATIPYTASGFACPDQVTATATLKGSGVSGRTTTKVAAGKKTPIVMTVHGPAGKTVKATFTIVLKTNGRPTTERKSVNVSFSR